MANRYWVGGTGTWNTSSTTNWSASSGGASGASVPTSADSVFFDQAATYTVTMTGALLCLDLTVSAGTVTFATGTTPSLGVSGSWSTTASTIWSATLLITFSATSSKTITTNGVTFPNSSMTFNGSGGSWSLQDNLTLAAARTVTLTVGTLNLGSYTLTVGAFSSSGTINRTLDFGTGKIVLNSATTRTIWNCPFTTGFFPLAISGTPTVECQGGGAAVTKTIDTSGNIEANSVNFSFLETTGSATYTFVTNSVVNNLTFNGAQTISNVSIIIYGSFTHSTVNGTTNFSAGTNDFVFSASSGSKTITPVASYTYDFPWTFDSSSPYTATWVLAANLKLGTSRTLTLTTGTLDLNNFTLTTGLFSSAIVGGRTLAFGSGKVVLTRAATATIWSSTANFQTTGTPLVECSGGGASVTKTITTGGMSESNAISFSFLETSGTATYALNGSVIKNIIVNGTQTIASNNATIYGSFTHASSGTAFTAGSGVWTFAATSGNYTITPLAAFTYDFPWTFNGVGGTWTLAGNLVLGSTRAFTITNGTLDLNNKTVSGPTSGITVLTGSATLTSTGGTPSLTMPFTHTSGTLTLGSAITTSGRYTHTSGTLDLNGQTLTLSTGYTTTAGTKNLTFNGGTMVCSAASTTAFNNAVPTGFTTSAGTATGKISMTAATAKTFVGGGSVYSCVIDQGGAGALTISGSNTFADITNSYSATGATTITLTAGTTQTVSNFSATGAATRVLTLNSTTTTQATLKKPTIWYMGANSTNVIGNTNLTFTAGGGIDYLSVSYINGSNPSPSGALMLFI